jgi:hypothetical protein
MEQKVKRCVRCRNNFTGDGSLCSFCVQKAQELEQQLREANRHPESPLVRCTIDRDGPTTVNFGQVRYVFEKNEHGHYVCPVTNLGHYEQLLRTPFYEAYETPQPLGGDIVDQPINEQDSQEESAVMTTQAESNIEAQPVTPASEEVVDEINEQGGQEESAAEAGEQLDLVEEQPPTQAVPDKGRQRRRA